MEFGAHYYTTKMGKPALIFWQKKHSTDIGQEKSDLYCFSQPLLASLGVLPIFIAKQLLRVAEISQKGKVKGQIMSLGEIMESCLELGRAPAQSP